MRIQETFLKGKHPDITLCEDGFYANEFYAVMIDGAGTPSPKTFHGKKGGRYIMELIRDSISYMITNHNRITFLEELSQIVLKDYEQNGWLEELKENLLLRPTASLAVYSSLHKEVWFYGDCKALIEGVQHENPKFIDDVMLQARKLFIEGEIQRGKTTDELREEDTGRRFIEPLLERQRLFQNRNFNSSFSYACFDGFGFQAEQIKVVNVPPSATCVVLSTDGYAVLKNTLEETERLLHQQLERDPLAIHELLGFQPVKKGFNSFDDRAYMKIRF